MFVKVNLLKLYLLINFERIIGVEGYLAGQHLIKNNTQTPVVSFEALTLVEDSLRGHVVGSAAEGVSSGRVRLEFLTESEIYQLYESKVVNHQIAWFDVPVHDMMRVQVVEYEDALVGVKSRV